MIEVPL